MAARVLLARFIQYYECPQSIVTSLFVELLKSHQAEARVLVKQALDILIPVLPKRFFFFFFFFFFLFVFKMIILIIIIIRLPVDGKYPTYIKWTKKIILEEGHAVLQLVLIWQVIVRHGEMFYDCRDQFIPQMVLFFFHSLLLLLLSKKY